MVGRSADEMVQRDFTEMVQADYDKAQRFFGDPFDSWVSTTDPQERATLVQSLEADIKLFQQYKYELDSGGWLAEQFNQLVNRTDMDGLAKAEERAALATLLGEYRQETVSEAIAYLTQPLQRNPDGSLVLDADGQPIGPGSAWYQKSLKSGGSYNPEQVGAILEVIGQTAEGAQLLRQVHVLEQRIPAEQYRLLTMFNHNDAYWASYIGYNTHLLDARSLFAQMPPELAAPTFAHELSHLLRRWEMGNTIQNEILSHIVEAQVLQSLQQQGRYPNISTLANHPEYAEIVRAIGLDNQVLNNLQDSYVDLTDYTLVERGYYTRLKPAERILCYEFPDNISDEVRAMRELIDQTSGGLSGDEFYTQYASLPKNTSPEEVQALMEYNRYRRHGE